MDSYIPQTALEKQFFDYLWDVANNRVPGSDPNGASGDLSGATAVQFFQRSSVDRGFLKQIWSLSTPAGTMNIQQFYTALRFITMIQNGEIPISKDRLLATAKENLGFPRFSGIDPPVPAKAQPTPAPVPVHVAPAAVPPAGALPPFAMTPQEHIKYHSLFQSYDANKDGLLSREEAVPVFQRSGMDAARVEHIYAIADEDKDGLLTSKEFAVAFHIIVCVTKRNHAMPTILPPALHHFLLNAPAVPPVDLAGPAPVPVPVPAPTAPAATFASSLPPTPAPVIAGAESGFGRAASFSVPSSSTASTAATTAPAAALSGFDAFDAVAPAPVSNPVSESVFPPTTTVAASSASTAARADHAPQRDQPQDFEVVAAIDGIKAAAKRAIVAQENAVESSSKTYSSLQGLKQRLMTEKISLEATVNNAQAAHQEIEHKLDLVTQDVVRLQEELRDLRVKLQETSSQSSNAQTRLNQAQADRAALVRDIESTLLQIRALNEENSELSARLVTSSADLAQQQAATARVDAQQQQQRQQVSALQSEIAVLSGVLRQVQQQKEEVVLYQTKLAAKVKAQGVEKGQERDRLAHLERQVQTLNEQVAQKETEKKALLQQLSTIAASGATNTDRTALLAADSDDEAGNGVEETDSVQDDSTFGYAQAYPDNGDEDVFGADNSHPHHAVDAFASAIDSSKSAATASAFASATTPTKTTSASAVAVDDADPFSDFDSSKNDNGAGDGAVDPFGDALPASTSDPATAAANAEDAFGSAPGGGFESFESDPFGDANTASPSAGPVSAADAFGTDDVFGSSSAADTATSTAEDDVFGSATSEASVDPFADSVAAFDAPAAASPAAATTVVASTEVAFDAAFDAAPETSTPKASVAVASVTDDDDWSSAAAAFDDGFASASASVDPNLQAESQALATSKSDTDFDFASSKEASPAIVNPAATTTENKGDTDDFFAPSPSKKDTETADPFRDSTASSANAFASTEADPFADPFASSGLAADDGFGDFDAVPVSSADDPFAVAAVLSTMDPFGTPASATSALVVNNEDDPFAATSSNSNATGGNEDDPFAAFD